MSKRKLAIAAAVIGAGVAGWKAHRYRNEIFDRFIDPPLNFVIDKFVLAEDLDHIADRDDDDDVPDYAAGHPVEQRMLDLKSHVKDVVEKTYQDFVDRGILPGEPSADSR